MNDQGQCKSGNQHVFLILKRNILSQIIGSVQLLYIMYTMYLLSNSFIFCMFHMRNYIHISAITLMCTYLLLHLTSVLRPNLTFSILTNAGSLFPPKCFCGKGCVLRLSWTLL